MRIAHHLGKKDAQTVLILSVPLVKVCVGWVGGGGGKLLTRPGLAIQAREKGNWPCEHVAIMDNRESHPGPGFLSDQNKRQLRARTLMGKSMIF